MTDVYTLLKQAEHFALVKSRAILKGYHGDDADVVTRLTVPDASLFARANEASALFLADTYRGFFADVTKAYPELAELDEAQLTTPFRLDAEKLSPFAHTYHRPDPKLGLYHPHGQERRPPNLLGHLMTNMMQQAIEHIEELKGSDRGPLTYAIELLRSLDPNVKRDLVAPDSKLYKACQEAGLPIDALLQAPADGLDMETATSVQKLIEQDRMAYLGKQVRTQGGERAQTVIDRFAEQYKQQTGQDLDLANPEIAKQVDMTLGAELLDAQANGTLSDHQLFSGVNPDVLLKDWKQPDLTAPLAAAAQRMRQPGVDSSVSHPLPIEDIIDRTASSRRPMSPNREWLPPLPRTENL